MLQEPGTHDEAFWTRYFRRVGAICPHCRYAMQGCRAPICPECGRVSTLAELRLAEDPSVESWYTSGAWAIMAACVLGLAPGLVAIAFGVLAMFRMFEGSGSGALDREAAVLLVVGTMTVLGLPAVAWAWKRSVRTVARWPMLIRWVIVGLFVLMAMAAAMGLLGTIAIIGRVG